MITETLNNLLHQTAFFNLDWGNYVMIAVACFFLYLAIKHEFEPLLLVPIAFGMLLVNIYPDIMLSLIPTCRVLSMRAVCSTISLLWTSGVSSHP